MGRGLQLTVSFVLGAALSAGAFLLLDDPGVGGEGDAPGIERGSEAASSPAPTLFGEDAPGLRGRGDASVESLAVSDEELAFLRQALATERERLRESRIRPEDSGLDVLERVFVHEADAAAALPDFEAFRSHVRPAASAPALIASTADLTAVPAEAVAPGTEVIEFGPGVFQLPRGGWPWGGLREDVKSLEIRGAGMDATVLRSNGGELLFVAERIEHCLIRDLTFDGEPRGEGILDVRGDAAVILEDVRMRGWTGSAGHGAPIGISGRVFLGCRGCEFLGIYGDRPGGSGVSVRGDSVVLFEDCLFVDLDDSAVTGWQGLSKRCRATFIDCTFENTPLADSRMTDKKEPQFPILVRGGTALLGPPGLGVEERASRWGADIAAEVEGVSYRPGVVRCTLDDLRLAVNAARLPEGGDVIGVELRRVERGRPNHFRLYVAAPGGRSVWTYDLDLEGGRTELERTSGGHRPGLLPPDVLRESLELGDLLSRVSLPDGLELRRVALSSWRDPESGAALPTLAVSVWPRSWVFDARDGSLLRSH